MGYYTAYHLTATAESTDTPIMPEELVAEVDKMKVFSEKDYEGGSENWPTWYTPEAKWFDWEKDMLKLSTLFPNVLFELHGEGDSSDDLWKAYFKGGMMQWAPGEIVYDDFSPSKLQKPKTPVGVNVPYSCEY